MSALGAFTFVLHSHLPYARLAGRWPHGEEWIHEAASETYIPLLDALYDLKEEGTKYKLTIGLTPVLAEQLADATVLDHLDEYLKDKIARAKQDILRFRGDLWEGDIADSPQPVDRTAAEEGDIQTNDFYRKYLGRNLKLAEGRFFQDILDLDFRALRSAGVSSRHSPGASSPSSTGPTASRRR